MIRPTGPGLVPGPVRVHRAAVAAESEEFTVIRGLIVLFAVFLVATFPATWLLMLFLGNVGVNVSYWGALPLGILVSSILGGITSPVRRETVVVS